MGTTINNVTGDLIKTKVGNQSAYESGWEAIFGNKNKETQNAPTDDTRGTAENSPVASD